MRARAKLATETVEHENGLPSAALLKAIGTRVKQRRKERGLSVERLSELSSVSTGLISLMERGKANPSFSTFVQVAHGLGVSLSWLFGAEQPSSPVVRRANRRRIGAGAKDGSIREVLMSTTDGVLEVIWSENPPGSNNEDMPYQHEGEEFGIVLSGTRDVHLNGVRYRLSAGDSISYSSKDPHWFANSGSEPSTSIWLVLDRRGLS
jgi:transcriptional regulator with XRE-family HTH domain